MLAWVTCDYPVDFQGPRMVKLIQRNQENQVNSLNDSFWYGKDFHEGQSALAATF